MPSSYRSGRGSRGRKGSARGDNVESSSGYGQEQLPRSSVTFQDPPTSSVLSLPKPSRSHFSALRQNPPEEQALEQQRPRSSFSSGAAPAKPALKSVREHEEELQAAGRQRASQEDMLDHLEQQRRALRTAMAREMFPTVSSSPSQMRYLTGGSSSSASPPRGPPPGGRAKPPGARKLHVHTNSSLPPPSSRSRSTARGGDPREQHRRRSSENKPSVQRSLSPEHASRWLSQSAVPAGAEPGSPSRGGGATSSKQVPGVVTSDCRPAAAVRRNTNSSSSSKNVQAPSNAASAAAAGELVASVLKPGSGAAPAAPAAVAGAVTLAAAAAAVGADKVGSGAAGPASRSRSSHRRLEQQQQQQEGTYRQQQEHLHQQQQLQQQAAEEVVVPVPFSGAAAAAAAGGRYPGSPHDGEAPYWQEQVHEEQGVAESTRELDLPPPYISSSSPYNISTQYCDSSDASPTSSTLLATYGRGRGGYRDQDKGQELNPKLKIHVPYSPVKDVGGPFGWDRREEGPGEGPGGDDDGGSSSDGLVPPGSSGPLPGLGAQLTVKAVLVGLLVGLAYALLLQRLALMAGLVPGMQIAITFSCWLILKLFTGLFGRDMQCIGRLASQEVAVAAATAYACASSISIGSYGSVLLAFQPATGLAAGVASPLKPLTKPLLAGFWAQVLWMGLVSLAGALLAMGFRKRFVGTPPMTFPTGTAAGAMINVLHTPDMSYHGQKQMARFAQWSVISFLFSSYQWVFNNPACAGFAHFPTFGLQALRYTWNFDFRLHLVGVGIMAPVGVAWSMLAGALLAWGLLAPLLKTKEGAWYGKDLPAWDPRGPTSYLVILGVALVFSEGLFYVLKALVGKLGFWGRRVEPLGGGPPAFKAARRGARGSLCGTWGKKERIPDVDDGEIPETAEEREQREHREQQLGQQQQQEERQGQQQQQQQEGQGWAQGLRQVDYDALSDCSTHLQFSLSSMEAALRCEVFMNDTLPSWLGLVGYLALLGVAVAVLPFLFSGSNLSFYHVAVVGALAPALALGSTRASGMTDLVLTDVCSKLLVMAFAAWSGTQGGAVVGLICGGIGMGVLYSATNMMYAYATGFTTMSDPTAILLGYLIGAGVGCVAGPLSWLFYSTKAAGSVASYYLPQPASSSAPAGDALEAVLPTHAAAVVRAAALVFASERLAALPMYSLWVGVVALGAGLVLCVLSEILPMKIKAIVPRPAAMAVVVVMGANTAVGVVLGCLLRLLWHLKAPRSAEAYAWVVGGALVAGEGVWALGRGLLTAFDVLPPICMSFTAMVRPR